MLGKEVGQSFCSARAKGQGNRTECPRGPGTVKEEFESRTEFTGLFIHSFQIAQTDFTFDETFFYPESGPFY